jgi:hypothetical protein
MSRVEVDFGALQGGAAQIGTTAASFGRGAGNARGVPAAAAPDSNATALLERVLDAIVDVLGKAASELEDISAGLTATAESYERTEEILANWHVPGGTQL